MVLRDVYKLFSKEVVGVKGTRSCLFTGWMVSCVLVARKLKGLWKRACLVKETKAYSVLDPEAKVNYFLVLRFHVPTFFTDPSVAPEQKQNIQSIYPPQSRRWCT